MANTLHKHDTFSTHMHDTVMTHKRDTHSWQMHDTQMAHAVHDWRTYNHTGHIYFTGMANTCLCRVWVIYMAFMYLCVHAWLRTHDVRYNSGMHGADILYEQRILFHLSAIAAPCAWYFQHACQLPESEHFILKKTVFLACVGWLIMSRWEMTCIRQMIRVIQTASVSRHHRIVVDWVLACAISHAISHAVNHAVSHAYNQVPNTVWWVYLSKSDRWWMVNVLWEPSPVCSNCSICSSRHESQWVQWGNCNDRLLALAG